MSYQVLARKWRPHNFSEIVGQRHVVTPLTNALQHQRLHHAYLFTGTRGVGKTTIARILAKALNCENRTDYNPCGQCPVCREVDEGRFLDLIEVDAASRTRVDDTRELLENAQYAPNSGKYKVYLIDEVHMLSGHSFNALLKTLEEPPPHVKFLLATTDPQKIPVTVLSRCLQFNLKRLLPDQISTQMQHILEQEQIAAEPAALRLIAQAADGSMRDGLSLLDQAIVYCNGSVLADGVREMLGTLDQHPVDHLLRALAQQDAPKILELIDEIDDLAPDYADLLRHLLQILHRMALAQIVPAAVEQEENAEMIRELATLFSAEDIQLYYQIGLIGQRDLELAPDPRGGFEMILLRMLAFRPAAEDNNATAKPAGQAPSKEPAPLAPERQDKPLPIAEQPVAAAKPSRKTGSSWSDMINAMNIRGLTRELANNCILDKIDETSCLLLLDAGHKQLNSAKTEQKLQQALQTYFGRPLKLKIQTAALAETAETPATLINQQRAEQQKAAEAAIDNDETIQALKDTFDARVIPGSIEPV